MSRTQFSKLLISLMLLIFLLNYAALKFYWYFSIWYFDMPMHFLGGLWAGLAAVYFFPPKDHSLGSISKILLLVLLIGVGWEIFEIIVNDTLAQNPFNAPDTISDLFFDLSGGAFAVLFFLKKIMPVNGNGVQLA